jgi:hypothetical protein
MGWPHGLAHMAWSDPVGLGPVRTRPDHGPPDALPLLHSHTLSLSSPENAAASPPSPGRSQPYPAPARWCLGPPWSALQPSPAWFDLFGPSRPPPTPQARSFSGRLRSPWLPPAPLSGGVACHELIYQSPPPRGLPASSRDLAPRLTLADVVRARRYGYGCRASGVTPALTRPTLEVCCCCGDAVVLVDPSPSTPVGRRGPRNPGVTSTTTLRLLWAKTTLSHYCKDYKLVTMCSCVVAWLRS